MSGHVEARATINMPGLPVGSVVLVDPDVPYIAMSLEAGHLVATGRTRDVRPAAPRARTPRARRGTSPS